MTFGSLWRGAFHWQACFGAGRAQGLTSVGVLMQCSQSDSQKGPDLTTKRLLPAPSKRMSGPVAEVNRTWLAALGVYKHIGDMPQWLFVVAGRTSWPSSGSEAPSQSARQKQTCSRRAFVMWSALSQIARRRHWVCRPSLGDHRESPRNSPSLSAD